MKQTKAKDYLKLGKAKVIYPPKQYGKLIKFTVATYNKNKDGGFDTTFVDCLCSNQEVIKKVLVYAKPKAFVSVEGSYKGVQTWTKDMKTFITTKIFVDDISEATHGKESFVETTKNIAEPEPQQAPALDPMFDDGIPF